jgi:hypothetical protein
VREGWTTGLRWFGWGVAGLLLVQACALWLRKDPLDDVARNERTWASIAGEVPKADPSKTQATNLVSNMNPHPGRGSPNPSLPPEVQSRVERITQSEILGPVMRPLPMGLLGIAGEDAFLRAPNGQTGLLRVGDELGGIRLLRIGVNRVLIEHEQQQKELTLFSGFGGETLLPGGETNPDLRPPVPTGN